MGSNVVELEGMVKRDAEAGVTEKGGKVLDFALEVWNDDMTRYSIIDCRVTDHCEAMEQLEGFVSEGETLRVVGHLERRTSTERNRLAGALIEAKVTKTFVMVDEIEED